MTETERLIQRIHAVATSAKKAPATISGLVLGSGAILANLENGKTITLAKYERAMTKLDQMERQLASEKARAA